MRILQRVLRACSEESSRCAIHSCRMKRRPHTSIGKQRFSKNSALGDEACVVAHSVGGAVVVRLFAEAEPPQPLAGALR